MTKERKPAILYGLQSAARLGRTALAAKLLEHGLYAGQDAILLQLAADDGLSPGVLAQRLGVRPPTVTKTIARLQTQGFVTKQASETDQRQAHVFLTEYGRDVIKAIEKSIRKTEKDALRGIDKKERKTFLKLLNRVEINLSARDAADEESVEDVE